MNNLLGHVKQVAMDDVRLFFAPFRGAIEAIKKELKRSGRGREVIKPEQRERPTKSARP